LSGYLPVRFVFTRVLSVFTDGVSRLLVLMSTARDFPGYFGGLLPIAAFA
jgi:hypothetical protein